MKRHIARTKKGVPHFLQSALWSVDVRHVDPKKHKRYVIEQVLNHGTWQQLQWLLKTYATREIKHILRHPSRGTWHDEALHYWESILNTKVPPMVRERALFSLEPRYFPLPHVK